MFVVTLILGLAAVILFGLAGLNVNRPRFAPMWWAFAALTLLWLWPTLEALGRG